jgi:AcrR family transcriptional regulator
MGIIPIAERQYSSVWNMRDNRLGPTQWVNAGLKALARFGFAALKADTLASRLRVSRGSFYWHFAHVSAYHAAILSRWREIALENIIAEIDGAADDRLETLLRRAFAAGSRMERGVRAWATIDRQAKAAVEAVDAARIRYLRKLLEDSGVPSQAAETRARILNWAYLGFALSSKRLDEESLKDVVRHLSQLARLKPESLSEENRGPPPVRRTRRRSKKP